MDFLETAPNAQILLACFFPGRFRRKASGTMATWRREIISQAPDYDMVTLRDTALQVPETDSAIDVKDGA